jgi:hypothetical protein
LLLILVRGKLMTELQPMGAPEKLQEYYEWRERELEAARLRAQTEGDDPPILTPDDEAALNRVWKQRVEPKPAEKNAA